jgi:hypothetical protein
MCDFGAHFKPLLCSYGLIYSDAELKLKYVDRLDFGEPFEIQETLE